MTSPYMKVDTRNEQLQTLAEKHSSLWGDFHHRLDMSWLYHDHGLEGIVLGFSEISLALSNKALSEQSQPVHQEIRNLYNAIQMIRQFVAKKEKERYQWTFLQEIYEVLKRDLKGTSQGDALRQEDGRYGAYYHKCCSFHDIENQMKKLFIDVNQLNAEDIHPLLSAARLHHRFMRIMPFGRFSGKVARLFTNSWLMRNNYPPAIVHAVERARYYEALALDDESELLVLMTEALNSTVESGVMYIEECLNERRRKRLARKSRKVEQESEAERPLEDAQSTQAKSTRSTKSSKETHPTKEKSPSPKTKPASKSLTKAPNTKAATRPKTAPKETVGTSRKARRSAHKAS